MNKIFELLKNAKNGIFVTASLACLLFVYAPLELYFTNKSEFWFDSKMAISVSGISFLCVIIICSVFLLLSYRINKNIYCSITIVQTILLISTYIQGTFMTKSLPPLDGRDIEWGSYTLWGMGTIFLYFLFFFTVLLLMSKVGIDKVCLWCARTSEVIGVFLIITIIGIGITFGNSTNQKKLVATTLDEFQISEDKNFIILLLDMVDARRMNEIVEDNKEYQEIFTDFVFYNNTLGVHPCTRESIPFILSGVWFENQMEQYKFIPQQMNSSPLFRQLEEENYSINIYDDELSPEVSVGTDRFDNMVIQDGKVKSVIDFSLHFLQLGGIKFAPYFFKEECYQAVNLIREDREVSFDEGIDYFSWDMSEFYNKIPDSSAEISENKIFKFIHLEGAHGPYNLNEQVQKISSIGTYEMKLKACLTTVKTYLDYLKENDAYDNSVIIIMADHGYPEDGDVWGRQNPILYIKGIGEHHEYEVSDIPVSFEDLQEIYSELLKGKESKQATSFINNFDRERRYLFYLYGDEGHMKEYIMYGGNAQNADELVETRKRYDLIK